jgi:endogenous inhibitor of DNA gyrase (YacG/DUF329 family)
MEKFIFKCPFCNNEYYTSDEKKVKKIKSDLYNHMDETHNDMLGGLSPAQVYFNIKYNKTGQKCVICKKNDTKWSEASERYERFCSDKCKEKYRQQFLERMKKAGKENQMNDPEHQKKMLENRRISGVYTWQDGGKTKYTGSYEKEFLEFLDIMMGYESSDVIGPAPQVFYYTYEGKQHFYIPDFYITSLNLLIEIKDGEEHANKHPKIVAVDKAKERLKDEVMAKQKEFNYLKVMDKNYSTFLKYLMDLKKK